MCPRCLLVHRETRRPCRSEAGALAIDEIVERIRVLTRTQLAKSSEQEPIMKSAQRLKPVTPAA